MDGGPARRGGADGRGVQGVMEERVGKLRRAMVSSCRTSYDSSSRAAPPAGARGSVSPHVT